MHADELVRPLSGADWWNVAASGDVPALKVTDGPSGARGERFVGGPPSVSFPCGAALGRHVGRRAGRARRRGAGRGDAGQGRPGAARTHGQPPALAARRPPLRVLLRGPVLTAHLAGRLRAGPAGRRRGGVREAPRGQRHRSTTASRSPPSPTSARCARCRSCRSSTRLRRAGAWSTMAAYNRLHGTHCSRATSGCSRRSCATSGAGTAW